MTEEEDRTANSNICEICKTKPSKYCCPRCNVLYCSLTCYKSNEHLSCSESFYKECIDQELKALEPDENSKNSMLKILTRNYRENCDSDDNTDNLESLLNSDSDNISECEERDSDDDDSLPDLEERLRDINLDDAEKVWEALSTNEKQDFEELLKSEDVTKILSIWVPWWTQYQEGAKIEEVNDGEKKEESFVARCPPLLKTIKHFSTISSRPPAACVKYNLLNILSGYVYVARLFNGEHHFFSREGVSCLHCVCGNLRGNVNYQDASTAVLSVVQECYDNPSITTDSETKKLIIEDLKCLLRGPDRFNKNFYVLSALSDIYTLLEIYQKNAAKENGGEAATQGEFAKRFVEHDMLELPQPSKKELLGYLRKLEYYLSFMTVHGDDVTSNVIIISEY